MKISILLTTLLLSPAAMAGVNIVNGNFYVTYGEFAQSSGGHELNLDRTYNSKSSENGWFGYGWGSTYETRLLVMPDGSAAVYEYGNGRVNYYAPHDHSGLQAIVDKIVVLATKRDQLETDEAATLRGKLLGDEELRRVYVVKYGIKSRFPVGGYAQSGNCAKARVTRMKAGYSRTSCDNDIDYFDMDGHLIQRETDGYKVTVHYTGKYPDRIEDTQGQKLFMLWNYAGHIYLARNEKSDPLVTFTYDEKDNLLLANTMRGNYYIHEYDGHHNMTKVGYIDNTHTDIKYDERDYAISVEDRDGSKISYAYESDPANPSQSRVNTTSVTASGEHYNHKDEFKLANDADGVQHIAALTRTDGVEQKAQQWDEKGRIKRAQQSDGTLVDYFYHPTLNKISAVVTDQVSTVFSYDKAGNLIRAYNTHGQLILLGYDAHKHINHMIETNQVDHTRRELSFKYNKNGKPDVIRLLGKGEIKVEYDAKGEISKVDSKQGVKMALGVTEAFQVLLQVVKVAGVEM